MASSGRGESVLRGRSPKDISRRWRKNGSAMVNLFYTPPDHGISLPGTKSRRRALTAALLFCSLLVALVVLKHNPESDSPSLLRVRNLQGQERQSDTGECTLECCQQSHCPVEPCPVENAWIEAIPVAVQWLLLVLLVCMSATFSGLTLGYLALDLTGLEIVMEGENEANARAARRIYPFRKNGNLLLCTCVLGNVAVNAMISILLADKAGGALGFVISTFVIVIFGEIVPQAICSRYGLEIGSFLIPLFRVVTVLLWPFTAPLAFCLDKTLGEELATTYSSSEMRKLLQIHVDEGRFDKETAVAMTGALQYKEILVKDAMSPIEKTFMLNVDERLNFECIARIFKTGYSRIPVYEVNRNNIIGLLFTKDLIFIDPEDETPLRTFISIFGRGAHLVWPDDKLGDVLKELKQGRSHMALVRDVNNEDETQDPFYEIKGIITLEDIIERIIGDQIVDETDAFVDGTHSVKVNRMESLDWGRLRLLDSKLVDERLSYEETKAVTAHLRTNYTEAVSLLSDNQLYRLVSETSVSVLPAAVHEVGSKIPKDLMYEKNVPTDVCTLILSGKVTVIAGADQFRSDVSSWSVLASSTLTEPSYTPDFTAFVSGGPCRCLRFTRARYTAAVDASAVERRTGHNGDEETEHNGGLTATTWSQENDSAPSIVPSDDSDVARVPSESPPSATQLRRKKLIAAFQKMKAKHEDVQDEDKQETEDNGSGSPSKEDLREKSLVSSLNPKEGGEKSPLAESVLRRSSQQQQGTEKEKQAQDAATGKKATSQRFQYIGSATSSRQLGDKTE